MEHIEGQSNNQMVSDADVAASKEVTVDPYEINDEMARLIGEIMMGRGSIYEIMIAGKYKIRLERLTADDEVYISEITADMSRDRGLMSQVAFDTLSVKVFVGAQLVAIDGEDIEADIEMSYYEGNPRKNMLCDRVTEFLKMNGTFADVLRELIYEKFQRVAILMRCGDLKKSSPTP